MDDFLKMDVFFIVATVAVALVTLLLLLILLRIFRILGYVEQLSKMVTEEGNLLRSDIAELRSSIRSEGFKIQSLLRLMRRSVQRVFTRKKG